MSWKGYGPYMNPLHGESSQTLDSKLFSRSDSDKKERIRNLPDTHSLEVDSVRMPWRRNKVYTGSCRLESSLLCRRMTLTLTQTLRIEEAFKL